MSAPTANNFDSRTAQGPPRHTATSGAASLSSLSVATINPQQAAANPTARLGATASVPTHASIPATTTGSKRGNHKERDALAASAAPAGLPKSVSRFMNRPMFKLVTVLMAVLVVVILALLPSELPITQADSEPQSSWKRGNNGFFAARRNRPKAGEEKGIATGTSSLKAQPDSEAVTALLVEHAQATRSSSATQQSPEGCCVLPSRPQDPLQALNVRKDCVFFCPIDHKANATHKEFQFRGETKTGTSVANMMLGDLSEVLSSVFHYRHKSLQRQAGYDATAYGFCGFVDHDDRVFYSMRCRTKHFQTADEHTHVVMSLRDPRDSMVSYYHHFRSRGRIGTKHSVPEGWCEKDHGPNNCSYALDRHLSFPVSYVQAAAEHRLQGLLVLPFHTFARDEHKVDLMLQVANFLGFDLHGKNQDKHEPVRALLAEAMKKFSAQEELKEPGRSNAVNKLSRLRKGPKADYHDELSEKDIAYMNAEISKWPLQVAWFGQVPNEEDVLNQPAW